MFRLGFIRNQVSGVAGSAFVVDSYFESLYCRFYVRYTNQNASFIDHSEETFLALIFLKTMRLAHHGEGMRCFHKAGEAGRAEVDYIFYSS